MDQPAIRPVSPRVSSESEPVDATIPVRREILGLFVLEAREWLNQIQTALERLDTTSEQARRSQLRRFCGKASVILRVPPRPSG